MEIVFDERKRVLNQQKHGYDFADLDATFFNRSIVAPARGDRLIAIGRFGDTVITVVFKALGTEAFSIISMRGASHKERSRL
jgi:hypothetical protein